MTGTTDGSIEDVSAPKPTVHDSAWSLIAEQEQVLVARATKFWRPLGVRLRFASEHSEVRRVMNTVMLRVSALDDEQRTEWPEQPPGMWRWQGYYEY